MKKLLPILLFGLILSFRMAPGDFFVTPVLVVVPGEYYTICYYQGGALNGKLYQIIGNAQVIAGIPGVVNATAGAHGYAFTDSSGFAWTQSDNNSFGTKGDGSFGSGSYSPFKILTDSAGNPFTGIAQVTMGGNAYGWNCIAIKFDGTVWGWGHLWNKISPKPVQILYPAGTVITQICQGLTLMALDTAGKVHTRFGGNQGFATAYINPQGISSPDTLNDYILPLPHRALRIAGSSFWSAAEEDNGDIVGWGPWPGFLGVGSALDSNSQHPTPSLSPIRIDTALGFRGPLIDLKASNAAFFAITADGVLHGWGDATQGTIGNGAHVNMAGYSPVFQWNQSENPAQQLVRKPVILLPGIQVAAIEVSNALNYGHYCRDVNGNTYAWGRNKGGQLGNGVMPCDAFGVIAATYPNSWDMPWITPVNPFAATNFGTTSPFCVGNPGGSQCSTIGCIIGVHGNPTANAGLTINTRIGQTFVLDASSSTAVATWGIISYLWTHISGPNNNTLLPAFTQSPMKNSIAGIDVYQVLITDNGWQTSTATVTVITSLVNSINVKPGGRPSIH